MEGNGTDFFRNPRNLIAAGMMVLLLAIVVYAMLGRSGSVNSPVPSAFTVNGKTYSFTYTASNDAQRRAGLMNKQVTDTTTMLFAFPAVGTYPFWMYDTNTSLDMIWINATGNAGKVVYVYADAQPCYSSCPIYPTSPSADYAANYVIEAKAGFAAANDIEVGTLIQFG